MNACTYCRRKISEARYQYVRTHARNFGEKGDKGEERKKEQMNEQTVTKILSLTQRLSAGPRLGYRRRRAASPSSPPICLLLPRSGACARAYVPRQGSTRCASSFRLLLRPTTIRPSVLQALASVKLPLPLPALHSYPQLLSILWGAYRF